MLSVVCCGVLLCVVVCCCGVLLCVVACCCVGKVNYSKRTTKTREGWSATFRVQGLVFFSFSFFLSSGDQNLILSSIAARFLVTFLQHF